MVDTNLVQKTYLERYLVKKTGKEIKLLVGKCFVCGKPKSIIVSDNVIQAEYLGGFFKTLGKKRRIISEKMAINVSSNPG